MENLKRDLHLTGRGCAPGCTYCMADVPKWSETEMFLSHAWAFGFFDHPDYKEDLAKVAARGGNVIISHDSVQDPGFRMPRMGNSLTPTLDLFYDQYLGYVSVNQMSTERMISKLKFQVGSLSNVNNDRVNFRMYKYNDLGPLEVSEAEYASVRKERSADQSSRREKRIANIHLDDQGIVAAFENRLREVNPTTALSCAMPGALKRCVAVKCKLLHCKHPTQCIQVTDRRILIHM